MEVIPRMNGLRRFLIRVLIAYLLVLMPGGALVLCWGGDGHVAIERSGEEGNCCAPAAPVRENGESTRLTDPSETCLCRPCLDIPLTLAMGIEASRPLLGRCHAQFVGVGSLSAVLPERICLIADLVSGALVSLPGSGKSPVLSLLRTACLRN